MFVTRKPDGSIAAVYGADYPVEMLEDVPFETVAEDDPEVVAFLQAIVEQSEAMRKALQS